jgi:enoyl-[acyl-carrier protein] reductase I
VHGAAFAPREELAAGFPFVQTSRAGFALTMDVSAYSLIALARGAMPLMERRGGGSIVTLTYLGSERVFQNYNVMGVAQGGARSVGPLPRRGSRSEEHPGERHLRGPDQDARGLRGSPASPISCKVYRDRAPLKRTVETSEVAMRRCSCSALAAAASPPKS